MIDEIKQNFKYYLEKYNSLFLYNITKLKINIIVDTNLLSGVKKFNVRAINDRTMVAYNN